MQNDSGTDWDNHHRLRLSFDARPLNEPICGRSIRETFCWLPSITERRRYGTQFKSKMRWRCWRLAGWWINIIRAQVQLPNGILGTNTKRQPPTIPCLFTHQWWDLQLTYNLLSSDSVSLKSTSLTGSGHQLQGERERHTHFVWSVVNEKNLLTQTQ